MLFDTHTHVNFPEFDSERDEVLREISSQNIWITNVGCDYRSSESAVELSQRFEKGVYATIGQHPTDSKEQFNEEKYSQLITQKVVAIGECGLDYYHEKEESGRKRQKEEFVKQIHFAQKVSLPLVIHCRDAYEDTLNILKKEYSGEGIIHSFTDSWETAKKFLDLGFFVALNAILIFDKTGKLADVAKSAPSDRILTETDAPFLSPVRGERNLPGNVRKVAEKIAELRGEPFEEVYEYTFNNALKIYDINVRP